MTLTLLLSVYIIRRSYRIGADYYDAGLFIIIPSSVSVIALLIFTVIDIDLLTIKNHWRIFQDIQVLYDLSLLQGLIVFSFSVSYFVFNKVFQSQSFNVKTKFNKNYNHTRIYKKSWIIVFISLSIIFYIFIARFVSESGFSGTSYDTGLIAQLKNLVAKMWGLSVVIFIYFLVVKSTKPLMKLALIVLIFALFNFYILGSKGGLVWFLIVASILETLKFRGNLITIPVFILTILGGGVIFSLFNVVESFYYGNGSWRYMMHLFEYQTLENNVNIIHSVDTGGTELRLGSTYIDSLFKFLPSILRPYEITTLSNWYLDEFLPGKRAEGFGAGFGAIAEGYINFGVFGVAIEGVIIGFFASMMRIIRFSGGLVGALIYASFVANGYKFFRVDIGSIMFKQVYSIVAILILFILVYALIGFFRKYAIKI
jgi:oligosaccharide repeat unit polymerase